MSGLVIGDKKAVFRRLTAPHGKELPPGDTLIDDGKLYLHRGDFRVVGDHQNGAVINLFLEDQGRQGDFRAALHCHQLPRPPEGALPINLAGGIPVPAPHNVAVGGVAAVFDPGDHLPGAEAVPGLGGGQGPPGGEEGEVQGQHQRRQEDGQGHGGPDGPALPPGGGHGAPSHFLRLLPGGW